MEEKSPAAKALGYLILFIVLVFVWLLLFTAINPGVEDYEPFPGASVVFSLLIVNIVFLISTFNSMRRAQQNLENAFYDVKVQQEKRDSLLSQAQAAVSGLLKHEQNVFGVNTLANVPNLLVLCESFPELKSDNSVMELLSQTQSCENILALKKEKYNAAVNRYNSKINIFPYLMFRDVGHFASAEYYDDRINHAYKKEETACQ